MADSNFRGPLVSMGPMEGNVVTQGGAQVAVIEPFDGPSAFYQGYVIPDVRFAPYNKDSLRAARFPGFLAGTAITVVDGVPSAVNAAGLAAGQHPTAATPMTLVTVAPGAANAGTASLAPAVPLIPLPGAANNAFPVSGTPVSVLAMDFGFTTGNTAGTATVTVSDSSLFQLGQWLIIGGAGNSAKTASLICQVTGIPSATTITINPPASSTLNNSPIGNMNAAGVFPSQLAGTAASPYSDGGLVAVFDPKEALARCVSITGVASASANNVTVKGYDIYGMPMSEVIPFPGGGGGGATQYGQKAFKYIVSITPATTDNSHNLSAGWGDTFGFPIRSDKWEYTLDFWNATLQVASTGWLKADTTSPATTSTGDVRGTIQVSTDGNGSAIGSGATASNGSIRLVLRLEPSAAQLLNSTPNGAALMFGVTQA
jgi:hypothetical protein